MKYYVYAKEPKYDIIGNKGRGYYRGWFCEIQPSDPERYESIWLRHYEVFDREYDHWETCGSTAYEIEMTHEVRGEIIEVDEEECSESDMWVSYRPLERKGTTWVFDEKGKDKVDVRQQQKSDTGPTHKDAKHNVKDVKKSKEWRDERRKKDHKKALDDILTGSCPGESNLVSLLSINLKLLINEVYNKGYNDGWNAMVDFDTENLLGD